MMVMSHKSERAQLRYFSFEPQSTLLELTCSLPRHHQQGHLLEVLIHPPGRPETPTRRFTAEQLTHVSHRSFAQERHVRALIDMAEVPSGEYELSVKYLHPDVGGAEGTRQSQTTQNIFLPISPGTTSLAPSRPFRMAGGQAQLVLRPENELVALLHVMESDERKLRRHWKKVQRRLDMRAVRARRRFAMVRLWCWLSTPLVPRGPIWLIGERADSARDNGWHFFTFCRQAGAKLTDASGQRIQPIYILDKNSSQWNVCAQEGHVVAHSSWRHRILMLHARVLINAYSLKHMVPKQWHLAAYHKSGAWRLGSYRVYLKHGILQAPATLQRGIGNYDLVCADSEAEAQAICTETGYDRQVVITGMPRLDALTPTAPSRRILFAPTWRRYLVPALFKTHSADPEEFSGSRYEQEITDFLRDPYLVRLLQQYDYRLDFLPHHHMRDFFDASIHGERIHLLSEAEVNDFQFLLRRCDVLITDYSSIQHDVAHLGTPVINWEFDREEFYTKHSELGWFDAREHGYGVVVTTRDQLLGELEHVLTHGPDFSAPDPDNSPALQELEQPLMADSRSARVAQAVIALSAVTPGLQAESRTH